MLEVKIPAITTPLFHTTLQVRISDINYGNHLGHDALIALLHEARVRMLNAQGYQETNIGGYHILVTRLCVDYLNESFYANELVCTIGRGDSTKTRLELYYQLTNTKNNKEIARAMTTIAFYDLASKKVIEVPGFYKALIS